MKDLLAKLLPDSFAFRYFSRLPEFNTWKKKYLKDSTPKFEQREQLYEFLYQSKINGQALNYFEMGVWFGAAIKSWNQLDTNQNSNYFGFDTFSGLPETWEGLTANAEPGTFNVGGSIENVKIYDPRVKLIEGLFQDTVPDFLANTELDTSRINIIHIDSDLYSSALYCLTKFDQMMKSGDIVIFDEFSSMDEFWALSDYCKSYRRSYQVLAHAGSYYQCLAIELI